MVENIKTDRWDKYKHLVIRREIDAKTTLLAEGDVAKGIYFIEQGCIRLWFNDHGKDITVQFFFEGEGVSSIESFITGDPSLFTMESIEPSIVYFLGKKEFQSIVDHSPEIKQQFDDITFQRLVLYQKLFLSRIKDSPEKRYKDLLQNSPIILQRVPQHYIASYLGITPVSLSRIRNRK